MARLGRPTAVAGKRPQGILPFEIELVDDAGGVTAHAGLPLVVETMRTLGLDRSISAHIRLRQRQTGFTEVEKVEALVLLMAAGGDCLDDIRILAADDGLCRLLGRELPSADTLRHFLYAFHDAELIVKAQRRRTPDQIAFIPEENGLLAGLAQVNVALVHAVAAHGKSTRATLDHDATIQESHKREALPHYKGGRGYQPVAVYWAEQDLVVADEYRDGNVPAGMDNLPLIQTAFSSLPATITQRFFRADSACYDARVLKWLADAERTDGTKGEIGFTISADMTRELHEACARLPPEAWALLEERERETVFCAEVEFTPGDWKKDAQPLRYVAVRFQARQGKLFANGSDTRYLAVVTNRDLAPAPILRWHWEKAGTIEHLHDVTKNEIAAGTPPCSRFGANAAWYRLSLLTYNVLSAMKSLALPPHLSSARPKRLRFALFNLAARISSHSGKTLMRVARKLGELGDLIAARARLLALIVPPAPA
jgi:hypothetical protein